VAVHHPIYSAYGPHPGSQHLEGVLDQACAASGRVPDLVLTSHVHNYQRFAAPLGGRQSVPFIVAGGGGYNKRLHVLSRVFHEAKLPIRVRGRTSRSSNSTTPSTAT
jgi:acid phosphatase type 7